MDYIYTNRTEAGRFLGSAIGKAARTLEPSAKPLILAIPRGGVQVGFELANYLKGDLDLIVPRKLGAPMNEELAIGAVMHDGTTFLNQGIVRLTHVDEAFIESEKETQIREAKRRLQAYRGDRPYPTVTGRTLIVVDDGVATGATMIAAVRWVKGQGAERVIVGVPVAPRQAVSALRGEADAIVCPHTPEPFNAIGQFYKEFGQVSDEEVITLLRRFWSSQA